MHVQCSLNAVFECSISSTCHFQQLWLM